MPINDDANARGGDRHDRGVGPDPSVHDELVRSVFDNYIDLLNQQNAMRLWSSEEVPDNIKYRDPMFEESEEEANDAIKYRDPMFEEDAGEDTHTLEGDPRTGERLIPGTNTPWGKPQRNPRRTSPIDEHSSGQERYEREKFGGMGPLPYSKDDPESREGGNTGPYPAGDPSN